MWCVFLVVARRHAYGPGGFRYLVWNLGLAWLPLAFALLLYVAFRRRHSLAELLALGAAWLVFLPNAPYMLTDFIHLGDRHRLVDSLIFASFAFTALALGFASMLLVQIVVTRRAGARRLARRTLSAVPRKPRCLPRARSPLQQLGRRDAAAPCRLDDVAGPRQPIRPRPDPVVRLRRRRLPGARLRGLYGVAGLVAALDQGDRYPLLLSNRQWPSRSSSSNPS